MKMKREIRVKEFVQNAIGEYSVLNHKIICNDDSDENYTAFEVIVGNSTNEKKVCLILRCQDDDGGIEILRGEDFYEINEKDFVMDLFLSKFLTFVEV